MTPINVRNIIERKKILRVYTVNYVNSKPCKRNNTLARVYKYAWRTFKEKQKNDHKPKFRSAVSSEEEVGKGLR